jgi:hypothetical protein
MITAIFDLSACFTGRWTFLSVKPLGADYVQRDLKAPPWQAASPSQDWAVHEAQTHFMIRHLLSSLKGGLHLEPS